MTPIRWILFIFTIMQAGRAMTLAFIGRAGGTGAGDPPAAWLMPLIGDAIIGISALAIAVLIIKGRSPAAWGAAMVWNIVGIWDALSAFVVHASVPWPEFFMIETFGASMFFMASGMHAVCIALLLRPSMREQFAVPRSAPSIA